MTKFILHKSGGFCDGKGTRGTSETRPFSVSYAINYRKGLARVFDFLQESAIDYQLMITEATDAEESNKIPKSTVTKFYERTVTIFIEIGEEHDVYFRMKFPDIPHIQ